MHQDVPIILAGNKTDLADVEREIYLEDVRDWLDQDFKQNKYVAASSNQCTSREKKKHKKHSSCFDQAGLLPCISSYVVPPLNCVINLLLFRINVLECSAANSYNIVNIFKSFLSLSKIDFGVLNGGETER